MMKETLDFLGELAVNNDREWFQANKERYARVKAEVEAFTGELIELVGELEPEASWLSPADCLYRIYRDTRFSADKRPYKDHIGIYINPKGGKKSEYCGYYVHLQPGNCLVGGGAWWPESALLREYRKEIYDNVEEYLELINEPDFKKHFKPHMQDELKTAPKGFPRDWEYIDLLKPRSFTVAASLTDKQMTSGNVRKRLRELFGLLKPYNDFFNFTLDEHPDLAVRSGK